MSFVNNNFLALLFYYLYDDIVFYYRKNENINNQNLLDEIERLKNENERLREFRGINPNDAFLNRIRELEEELRRVIERKTEPGTIPPGTIPENVTIDLPVPIIKNIKKLVTDQSTIQKALDIMKTAIVDKPVDDKSDEALLQKITEPKDEEKEVDRKLTNDYLFFHC